MLTERQIVPSATVEEIDFGAVRSFMRTQGPAPSGSRSRARGRPAALLNDARNRMVRVTFDLRPDPLDDAGRNLT